MWRTLLQLTLLIWFRENIKNLALGILPIMLVYLILDPLYHLWDKKLTELGYGLIFLLFYTFIYMTLFAWAYFYFRKTLSNNHNKKILKVKNSISRNANRLDRLLDVDNYPELNKKTDKILKE